MEAVTRVELNDAWTFTCLLPVHGLDDPGCFAAALASVAQGTVAPSEILLCQDGPLPTALAAAVEAGAARFGARVVRNSGPKGLHHNLNHAAAAVGTPWMCRADADDINLPGRFAAQLAFLRAHPEVDVLGGAILEFWPDGRTREKALPTTHDGILRWARFRSPINHMTAFFRTRVFRDVGGYPDIPRKEDYGLWVRMIEGGYRFANLKQPLVRARLGADFYARRSGFDNIASEWALFRLKRRVTGIGGAVAALALVARCLALTAEGPARLVYETVLRR